MKTPRSLWTLLFAFGGVALLALATLLGSDGLIAGSRRASRESRPATELRQAADNNSRPAQQTAGAKATAGDAYMNIQVLKDIPSDQLLPAMRYITVALGVECNFCHDTTHYDSDDKSEKGTARNMMKMMFAINKDNFNGRREVTCYTCHRGASHAANIPSLTPANLTGTSTASIPAPGGTSPGQSPTGASGTGGPASAPNVTVDEIIAKYTEALGGAAAVGKLTSFEKKGTFEMPSRNLKAQAEMWRKAPDKELTVVHLPNGPQFAQGFNGIAGWEQRPGRPVVDELTGDDLVRAKQAASFIPGLSLKQDFARAQVTGIEKIGDRDAYRVAAFRSGGGQVRFYFDTQSGLLLRVSDRIESPLGAVPRDTNYSDYRDVNAVKVAFTVTVAQADGTSTFEWDQIEANPTIEDSRFEKPAPKAAEKP